METGIVAQGQGMRSKYGTGSRFGSADDTLVHLRDIDSRAPGTRLRAYNLNSSVFCLSSRGMLPLTSRVHLVGFRIDTESEESAHLHTPRPGQMTVPLVIRDSFALLCGLSSVLQAILASDRFSHLGSGAKEHT